MRIRINIFLAFTLMLIITKSLSQTHSDSLISAYTEKMKKYLDKDGKASELFRFTKEGIEVYCPATDTVPISFHYLIYWNELATAKDYLRFYSSAECEQKFTIKGRNRFPVPLENDFKKTDSKYQATNFLTHIPNGRLEGIKIALDPGHIGGTFETAKREKRWVEIKNPPARLIEGNLTLATAKILKKKLEAEGARVMLTKEYPGVSAFGISFEKWKDSLFHRLLDSAYKNARISFEEKYFLLNKARDIEIFQRFFLSEDLRERVRKVNEFNPHLTLIIHYNVDETNINWNKPTKKNYNMAFVGGSFVEDELNTPEARIDFLRLLLTDDIENSIKFSKFIVEGLENVTKVPAAMDSSAVYLKYHCLNTEEKGVFCRNLLLTRVVKGTLCYGESLYQDNVNECQALSREEISIEGMKTSKRVQEVADAYFWGIMNYIKFKNRQE